MIKLLPKKQVGSKRNFLFYGGINVCITNCFLQLMLLFFPISVATFSSQIVNMSVGFFLYGKKVFLLKELNTKVGIKYITLATCLWISNWQSIEMLSQYGLSRNIAAVIALPVLATASYLAQKYLVFI